MVLNHLGMEEPVQQEFVIDTIRKMPASDGRHFGIRGNRISDAREQDSARSLSALLF